jgi:lipopolysaccharide transport system permease protein
MASRLSFPVLPLGFPARETPVVAPPHFPPIQGPVVVIEASGFWPGLRLRELWAHRSLFLFLVWRDLKVKYAQTVFGAGWAILQPVLTMLVFTAVFGIFAGLPSDGVPFSLFALSALVPWLYFSNAVTGASNSLISSNNLITKVYFPRLVIPFAPLLAGLVDFAFAFTFLIGLMAWKGFVPTSQALFIIPLLIAATMMTAAGVGCWLAALNIQYRDVGHTVPFLLQVWMYCSAIFYPASMVPEAYRSLYALNPMVGVVECFRAVLLGTSSFGLETIGISLTVATLLFVSGVMYFRRTERVFADVI